MTTTLTLAQSLPGTPRDWLIYGGAAVLIGVLMFFAIMMMFALRKSLRRGESSAPQDEFAPPRPRSENEAAFLTASMQSVIARLKEQEKELERLHRQEKDRAQQTAQLSVAVTRNMPTGLLLINEAGLISMSNPAAETVLGSSGLAFRRYSEVLGPDSALVALLSASLREGRTFQREEVDHLTPAGALRRLGLTISPVLPPGDAKSKITGALCLLTDLTELSALQQQVRLRENLAALGEMSAGIAHEFKNSLATISGHAQLIRSEAPAYSETAESAAKIFAQTQQLASMVTEFLRFARPLEVSAETIATDQLVRSVLDECARQFPAVHFSAEGDFRPVAGDETLLRQALANLLRNAAQASPPLGSHPPQPEPAVAIIARPDDRSTGPGLRLSITDNGPGIASDDLPRLFLPFFTTKPDGTGLGLALVQKIVVHHGGSVTARNRPEGGAEFIVWLPAVPNFIEAVDSPPPRI
jgi:signal transduction histidine kinase